MKKASILIALTLVAISNTVHHTTATRGRFVGGRTQVSDVSSNKEVQELGRFSVHDYNLSGHLRLPTVDSLEGRDGAEAAPLRFVRVVEAERQVVAGVKYYLKVEAVQGGERRVFDAEVVVKPWLHSKQLLNFGPSSKLL